MLDDFLTHTLLLDLETRGEARIFRIGAVAVDQVFERLGDFDPERAFVELDRLAGRSEYVLGHNLLGHDLPVLRQCAPGLALHRRPVVDTLYLSPLAFPENPYHHLVKDYKLVRSSINDPVADARLAARVFRDQWQSFATMAEAGDGALLAYYGFCLVHDRDQGGLANVFRRISRRAAMDMDEAVDYLEASFADVVCLGTLRELARRELARRPSRPPWAYAVAWLRVAGGNSVLPPWVRHRYPATVRILRALRETPCGEASCRYCSETHDPAAQLRRFFGFAGFRPQPAMADGRSLQGEIARRGLADRPHLAILATGAGKSICYQLPALVRYFRRGVLTIVISPLQALMKDQVDNLNNATGTDSAAALYGLLTPPERGAVLERVRLGEVALLYVAPEQLRNASFRRIVEQREIGSWVFDEAHCLSKWGHDFRPDYLYAARFIRGLAVRQGIPVPPIACFTATAKRDVRAEIVKHFSAELEQELEVFSSRVERDELSFRVESVKPHEKLARILELVIESLGDGSAVAYFATRRGAEQGAEFLRQHGVVTAAFHGGLGTAEKRDILDDFVHGRLRVVCATNAFGMGIDKDDVRLVVHADVPGSLESYLQEAGRAGRDHLPSDCVLLFDEADVEKQFKLAATSRLDPRDITQILRALRRARRTDEGDVVMTPGELLRDEVDGGIAVGDRQADTKVKTAVAWLERSGFVERDENRTRVFQGRLRVESLQAADERLRRLHLSQRERRRWLAILKALLNADPDQGLSADDIAELPDVRWDSPQGDKNEGGERETRSQKVLRILHDMTEAGLLSSGLRLTAYLKAHGPKHAAVAYDKVCRLERSMLELLAEAEPDADNGEWFELSVPPLNQRLVDDELPSSPELLRRLLRSLSEDGKGLAGRRGSLELAFRARGRFRVRLLRSWNALTELAERRQALGRVVLELLRAKVPPDVRAKVLVEVSSDELVDAIRRDLVLGGQIRDRLAAAERALLFLHEQKIIQLQQGLAVFRQAMTIRLLEESKGRRYARGDYEPLAHHYSERTFQIHVMARYAQLGLDKVRSALALVGDYFEQNRARFVGDYFSEDREILERATSHESFRRIVDELRNPSQIRLVAAPTSRNLLILAGPGSGKTRVVVHRAAYLLRVERVAARGVLVLCFNRNAALEVRRRLVDLVGSDARGVTVLTYHALAMRLTGTSFAPWGKPSAKLSTKNVAPATREPDFARLIPEAVELLNRGDELAGLDADELRERLLEGYSHILVDEYQDINREQYELVSAVAGRTEPKDGRKLSILAVGDDDQNIYAWSGADVEFIRRFRDDYRAEVHYLVENYRSTAHIIAAANELIALNRERMKTAHPIRVDAARRGHPAGEKVQVVRTADAVHEAVALAERLFALKERDDELDWRDCAVLARRHAVLEPIRAVLEDRGIPVSWTPERGRLPPLTRVREIERFLFFLEEKRRESPRASELSAFLDQNATNGANPWWRLLREIVGEWCEETSDVPVPTTAALEFLYEALAERRREPSFGDGVRLLTVHAAKGLEFRHVLLPGGWRTGKIEEERRLYYVGMTRARETLCLFDRDDEPNPHIGSLRGESVESHAVYVEPPREEVVKRRYRWLDLSEIHLSFPGWRGRENPIHDRLATLEPGARLAAAASGSGVHLYDASGGLVGSLSKEGARNWLGQLDAIESLAVVALVQRFSEDSDVAYRSRYLVPRWEIPLVEAVLTQASPP